MTVTSKDNVFSLVKSHHEQIKAYGVKRLGLFGSFVREEQDGESDVDLLVEFEAGKKTFDNFMHLCFYLEELFEREVELLTPESLNPYIGPRILKEAEYVTLQGFVVPVKTDPSRVTAQSDL